MTLGRVTLVLFRRRAPVSSVERHRRTGARVRKSRQKEAAGAADAGVMEIEWRAVEVLKLIGVGTEVEDGTVNVGKQESMVKDGVRRGQEVGIESGARRTGAERGEPCRVCELG